jgi:hypothetical protein
VRILNENSRLWVSGCILLKDGKIDVDNLLQCSFNLNPSCSVKRLNDLPSLNLSWSLSVDALSNVCSVFCFLSSVSLFYLVVFLNLNLSFIYRALFQRLAWGIVGFETTLPTVLPTFRIDFIQLLELCQQALQQNPTK